MQRKQSEEEISSLEIALIKFSEIEKIKCGPKIELRKLQTISALIYICYAKFG